MKKERYYYNANTLKYEKVGTSVAQIALRAVGFMASTALFAFIILSLGFEYITPQPKRL